MSGELITTHSVNGLNPIQAFKIDVKVLAITSVTDRYGFIIKAAMRVKAENGQERTFRLSKDTGVRELANILSLPRTKDRKLLKDYVITLQSTGQMEDNVPAVYIPHGGSPFTGFPPTCPHCSDGSGRWTALVQVNGQLRCPNPVCPQRAASRVLHFLYMYMAFISPSYTEMFSTTPSSILTLSQLFDQDLLVFSTSLGEAEKNQLKEISIGVARLYYANIENTHDYGSGVFRFLMSLSIPGLTPEMIREAIALIYAGTSPQSLIHVIVGNMSKSPNNKYQGPRLSSFHTGGFPHGREVEFYCSELLDIEQRMREYEPYIAW